MVWRNRDKAAGSALVWAFGLATLVAPLAATAESPAETPSQGGAEASQVDPTPAPVPLDRLLRLPSNLNYEVETRGGFTRSQWRARFTKAIRTRETAKQDLDESRDELSEMGSKAAAWNLGTPGTGGGAVNPTNSFELDQKIRRQERELDKAESELESLRVEANLARVPEDWRKPVAKLDKTSANDDW